MKTIAPLLFSFLFLVSCETAIKDEAVTDKETPDTVAEIIEPVHSKVNDNKTVNTKDDLIGYWVGWFLPDEKHDNEDDKWDDSRNVSNKGIYWARENKITISIDTIKDDTVLGHSIVAGNFRPFKGTIELDDNTAYVINATEPGDDKYDGEFSFEIVLKMDTLRGTWQAYKKIQTSKRKYSLTKKSYEYNPKAEINRNFVDWMKSKTTEEEYIEGHFEEIESFFAATEKVIEYNASVDLLTEKQVERLTKADIYVLRNSIYAKHGYSFKKRQLRVFFDSHDWYMPVHVNIKNDLTDIEKQNIKLLLRYEKYAEEYYDEFGR